MIQFIRRNLHLIVPGVLFCLIAGLSLLSEGYYGGADNISHYFISHYAFKYPHLFLSAWGRPLYTIISAPFAQFGLQGLRMLNILLGISSAWFIYRIAKMLDIKPAWLSMVFVCFMPLYLVMLPTALTEILFSFVLVLSIFLFIRRNFIAAAIVISFIPFARTEGYILLPLFLLYLWYYRQFKAMPFLAFGMVFFTLLGCFYFKDLFWVFNQFPYPVTYHHPIYNKPGSLLHFLEVRHYIIGLPLEILFLGGIIIILRDFFSHDKAARKNSRTVFLLILVPLFFYTSFHAVLFWKALGGSMGLERVLAAVLPLAGLTALVGYQGLEGVIGSNKYVRSIFMTGIVAVVVITAFRTYVLPFPLSPEEETIKKAAGWFKRSSLGDNLLFYTDNNVPYYLGADPFRKSPVLYQSIATCKALDTLPAGSVVIWDAHFGANESKIPLDSLLGNRHQQLVNYFRPREPWTTFGGYDYECCITKTLAPGQLADNYAIRDSLKELIDISESYRNIFLKTFEQPGDVWDTTCLSRQIVYKGRFSCIMDARTEFSQGLSQKVSTLPEQGPAPGLRASVYVYLPERITGFNTLLVISFEHKNQSYSYLSLNLNEQKTRINHWNRITLTSPLPGFKSPDDLVKVYIWNPGKQHFYIDNLRVDLIRNAHQPDKSN